MTEKSEALQLADELAAWEFSSTGLCGKSAAAIRRLHAQRAVLLEALKNVTVHLIAAHSLLQLEGKKAAASDTMFSMMLADYKKSFEVGRAAIKAVEEGK